MVYRSAIAGLLGLLALTVLLHDLDSEPQATQDTREQLLGEWLREYDSEGHHVQRVLTLQPGGEFHETVRVVDRRGAVSELRNAGWWLFDGTNLKRRYTSLNGDSPSRLRAPFATFQISFETPNEFTGVDNVHHYQVHYRRVD